MVKEYFQRYLTRVKFGKDFRNKKRRRKKKKNFLFKGGNGSITTLAYKMEIIVFGDTEGSITGWDLRSGQTRKYSTGRGFVKKIRFAPGKENMKLLVLYHDGVDVIDLKGEVVTRKKKNFAPKSF